MWHQNWTFLGIKNAKQIQITGLKLIANQDVHGHEISGHKIS